MRPKRCSTKRSGKSDYRFIGSAGHLAGSARLWYEMDARPKRQRFGEHERGAHESAKGLQRVRGNNRRPD